MFFNSPLKMLLAHRLQLQWSKAMTTTVFQARHPAGFFASQSGQTFCLHAAKLHR